MTREEALEGSIEKWTDAEFDPEWADQGDRNCPLCEYYRKISGCKECPVKKKTGYIECNETPFREWVDHHDEQHTARDKKIRVQDCDECLRLIRAERDFLVSLREPKEEEMESWFAW